ncbi:MAG: DUF3568 family protein [Alphaproteobacteria bacterium]
MVLLLGLAGLSGCAAVALTAGGIAGGAGVDHTLSGIAYKTFAAPIENVRLATLQTLKQMDMSVKDDRKVEAGWEITASANDRDINVELEALTPRTTRMRVVVNKGEIFFKDAATGTEIIVQTADKLVQQAKR